MATRTTDRFHKLREIGVTEPRFDKVFLITADPSAANACFRLFWLSWGIYFLFYQGEVVYVGQSGRDIAQRLGSHYRKQLEYNNKPFDSFAVLELCGGLDESEADYILLYNPKYNVAFPSNKKYLGFQDYPPYGPRKRFILKLIREGLIWSTDFQGSNYVLAKDLENFSGIG